MFQLSDINLTHVLIGVVCLSILAFLYYSFIYEGFDKDACILTTQGVEEARQTMKEIEKTVAETNQDQFNLDINHRDMQTRDIILGEESKSWCSGMNNEDVKMLINNKSKHHMLTDEDDIMVSENDSQMLDSDYNLDEANPDHTPY